ncbi:hypothetical protein D7036_05385 [Aquimarina sp. BL5]|uniref:hypothetical protein n=1 Tax=Aquimarina sp. BL5 TaxID=1714860 RepID=UPI000EBEC41C|nr:hypothetical protein [Aquimarina sp. BL5]RKN08825.1 hypothetical protein D7036_05385 [Aquimarina sp. BL5]
MKTILTLGVLCMGYAAFGQGEADTPALEIGNIWNWNILMAAFIGCFLQEFIYWFELRSDIAKGNFPAELSSKAYWVITIIAVIIFSTASFLYFTMLDTDSDFLTIAIFSAGFPRIFKSLVAKVKAPPVQEEMRINSDKIVFGIREYFMR